MTNYEKFDNDVRDYINPPFKTPYNAHLFPKEREKNFGPSKTVPDQTMSLKTILERYSRGMPIEGQEGVYNGEDIVPDLRRMDLSEIADLTEEVRDAIQADIEDRAERERQNAEARKTMEQRELFKKWKAEEESSEPAPKP